MSQLTSVCKNCNFSNSIESNSIAIRCERCRLIHCIMCKRNHDPACDIFEESQNRTFCSNSVVQQKEAVPNNIISTSVSMANISASQYIYCDLCKTQLKTTYYGQHLLTKKHKMNVLSGQNQSKVSGLTPVKSEPNFFH